MNAKVAKDLLKKMESLRYSETQIKEILKIDEQVLEKINFIDYKYFSIAIKYALKFKDKNKDYLFTFLKILIDNMKKCQNQNNISVMENIANINGISLSVIETAFQIIADSESNTNFSYIIWFLENNKEKGDEFIIKALKIFGKAKNNSNSKYIRMVLMDSQYENCEPFEIATIFSSIESEELLHKLFSILKQNWLLKMGLALPVLKIMAKCQNVNNIDCFFTYISVVNEIKSSGVLPAAKIFSESLNDFNAEFALKVMTNKTYIEDNTEMKLAYLMNSSKQYFNASYAYAVLEDLYKINELLAVEGVSIINACVTYAKAKCTYLILTNQYFINNQCSNILGKLLNDFEAPEILALKAKLADKELQNEFKEVATELVNSVRYDEELVMEFIKLFSSLNIEIEIPIPESKNSQIERYIKYCEGTDGNIELAKLPTLTRKPKKERK